MKSGLLASSLAAALLAACSGAPSGSSSSPSATAPMAAQRVQVTLTIKAPATTSFAKKRPAFVGTATTGGYARVDTAAPIALNCTGSAPAVCTATFDVLTGTHTFAGELNDTNNNVLSEGSTTADITTGSPNVSLTPLGVASTVNFDQTITASGNGGTGTITAIGDADGDVISGTAFDNPALTVVQTGGGGVVTIGQPAIDTSPGGSGAFTVTCTTAGTFTLGVTAGTQNTLFGDWSGVTPSLVYPATAAALTGANGTVSSTCVQGSGSFN
ncbi:MAG TPA: hypothetical protein VMD91_12440 [Candidatus Sulfotelmatobacter sp.]|nr:hypothetical protein [Candidatus Sulfotelmatobacter sp.]